ncbi:MAG: hypothetical protein LBH61_06030, partial [Dysgonamonadaceae bacterium]|nr:hypothetical protein [Dysgonamonadaceae bacterium]
RLSGSNNKINFFICELFLLIQASKINYFFGNYIYFLQFFIRHRAVVSASKPRPGGGCGWRWYSSFPGLSPGVTHIRLLRSRRLRNRFYLYIRCNEIVKAAAPPSQIVKAAAPPTLRVGARPHLDTVHFSPIFAKPI